MSKLCIVLLHQISRMSSLNSHISNKCLKKESKHLNINWVLNDANTGLLFRRCCQQSPLQLLKQFAMNIIAEGHKNDLDKESNNSWGLSREKSKVTDIKSHLILSCKWPSPNAKNTPKGCITQYMHFFKKNLHVFVLSDVYSQTRA